MGRGAPLHVHGEYIITHLLPSFPSPSSSRSIPVTLVNPSSSKLGGGGMTRLPPTSNSLSNVTVTTSVVLFTNSKNSGALTLRTVGLPIASEVTGEIMENR